MPRGLTILPILTRRDRQHRTSLYRQGIKMSEIEPQQRKLFRRELALLDETLEPTGAKAGRIVP